MLKTKTFFEMCSVLALISLGIVLIDLIHHGCHVCFHIKMKITLVISEGGGIISSVKSAHFKGYRKLLLHFIYPCHDV